MKSYTDIEQSKKLAEMLPLESADMAYFYNDENELLYPTPFIIIDRDGYYSKIYCWSLAALQDIIKINYKLEKTFFDQSDYCTYSLYDSDKPTFRTFEYDNPVDACIEMIIKLHEQNIL